MKAILLYFYVAILPLIIHGNLQLLIQQLEKMASENKSINGIFQPANYLGKGMYGRIFKGTILKPIKREVAMKFTPISTESGRIAAELEYQMYTYLGAINNTDVESYGIPAVYYYGKWNDYILMAITLLDSEYKKRIDNRTLKEVDTLIIAREFVKITKYIHSRGVHHGDIGLDNMMFRKQRVFIIDFNTASGLHIKPSSRTFGIPPKNVYEDRRYDASKDFSYFLRSVCDYYEVCYGWFNAFSKSRKENPNHCIDLEDHIPSKNNPFAKEEFRQVFVEFFHYKSKMDDCYTHTKRWQLYDDLYQFISAKIDDFELPKPVFVSWLTDKERKEAMDELQNKRLPDISSIKDRFANVQAEYPKVNYNYFAGLDRVK